MKPGGQWLVFDPYLASSGGGERYMFAFAAALARAGQEARLAGPDADRALLQRLGFPDLELESMTTRAFIGASRRFDASVCLTNHPPPPSLARTRFAVVQFPFTGFSANALRARIERFSLRRTRCIVYSEFARRWLRTRWGVDGVVLPPAVELGDYEPGAKRQLILNVGRFFPSQHSKRQDALVDAFAAVPAPVRAGWRLVLAGGVANDPAAHAYVDEVRRKAAGLPVEVMTNVDAGTLRALYREAALYWHATGLDRREDEPEKAEHFGMTTVEAMSYGVVPVVIADGGQREIVDAGSGVLWRDRDALVRASTALMESRDHRDTLAGNAAVSARRFGVEAFDRAVRELVASVAG